jgi:hypothetical protein
VPPPVTAESITCDGDTTTEDTICETLDLTTFAGDIICAGVNSCKGLVIGSESVQPASITCYDEACYDATIYGNPKCSEIFSCSVSGIFYLLIYFYLHLMLPFQFAYLLLSIILECYYHWQP